MTMQPPLWLWLAAASSLTMVKIWRDQPSTRVWPCSSTREWPRRRASKRRATLATSTATRLPTRRMPPTVAIIMSVCQPRLPSSPVIVPGSIACMRVVHSRARKPSVTPSASVGTSPQTITSRDTASTAARAMIRCQRIRAQAPRDIRASKR